MLISLAHPVLEAAVIIVAWLWGGWIWACLFIALTDGRKIPWRRLASIMLRPWIVILG